MALRSLDTVKRCIKKFHKFLFDVGKTSEDFQAVFSFTVPQERKVKKPADLDEVAQVLSSINRDTAIGKRDYAIILLLFQYICCKISSSSQNDRNDKVHKYSD